MILATKASRSSGERLVTMPRVGHPLAVHPAGAGVLQILADRLVGGGLLALQRIDLHRRPGPWRIAATTLPLSRKARTDPHRIDIHAQQVRIDLAAGDHQSDVVVGAGIGDLQIGCDHGNEKR